MFVFCWVAFGLRGQLNVYEIPRALMFVPMVLAAGMVARRLAPATDLLQLPVAFAGASIVMTIVTSVIYILAQYQLVPFVETYWNLFDDVVLAWLVLIVAIAVLRLRAGRAARSTLHRHAAGAARFVVVVAERVAAAGHDLDASADGRIRRGCGEAASTTASPRKNAFYVAARRRSIVPLDWPVEGQRARVCRTSISWRRGCTRAKTSS